MSLTQAAAAIVTTLAGGSAAEGSNRVGQVPNFYDLATGWHGFSLRFEASTCEFAGVPACNWLAASFTLEQLLTSHHL